MADSKKKAEDGTADPEHFSDKRKVEPLTPPNPSGPVEHPQPRTKPTRKD